VILLAKLLLLMVKLKVKPPEGILSFMRAHRNIQGLFPVVKIKNTMVILLLL